MIETDSSKETQTTMEEVNTEEDTTIAAVTPKVQILKIGSGLRNTKPKISKVQCYQCSNFKEDSTAYIGLLLLGNRAAANNTIVKSKTDWFGVNTIEEKNQPKQCHFCVQHAVKPLLNAFYFNMLINADSQMHEVRKRLKDEKWISKYVIELPPRSKNDKAYTQAEQYHIENTVRQVRNDEAKNIFKYVYQLHREYVKENARNCV